MRLAGVVPILTRAMAILSDLLVLIITWMKTGDAWRMSRQLPKRSRPKLLPLVVRNGEFRLIFVLNERKLTYFRYPVFRVSTFPKFIIGMLLTNIASALFGLNTVTLLLDVIADDPESATSGTQFIIVTDR